MHRRRFLVYAASAPLLAAAGCKPRASKKRGAAADSGGRRIPPAPTASDAKVLTVTEWVTLEALCARLLPTDQDPGATEAGVVGYIDRQLALPPVSGFLRMLRVGLRKVDGFARRLHRRRFADLDDARRDKVIAVTMRSRRMGGRSGAQFYRVVLSLLLEGFLCDPVYGGNRNEVGWKLVQHVPQLPRPFAPYSSWRS